MTTTELIELLKSVEYGASGRSREISFILVGVDDDLYISEPIIKLSSSGDGVAGAELTLSLFPEIAAIAQG